MALSWTSALIFISDMFDKNGFEPLEPFLKFRNCLTHSVAQLTSSLAEAPRVIQHVWH